MSLHVYICNNILYRSECLCMYIYAIIHTHARAHTHTHSFFLAYTNITYFIHCTKKAGKYKYSPPPPCSLLLTASQAESWTRILYADACWCMLTYAEGISLDLFRKPSLQHAFYDFDKNHDNQISWEPFIFFVFSRHRCTHTQTHQDTHNTCVCGVCVYIYIYIYIYTCMHAYMHTYIHTYNVLSFSCFMHNFRVPAIGLRL